MFTLLCIDDEPSINTLHKILFEANGYRVLLASNGPDGIRLLQQEPVDLVILDYKMPEMTGAEVAAAIRQTHPTLPILMESAYVDLPSTILKHVSRYITKGQSPSIILQEVRALLDHKDSR